MQWTKSKQQHSYNISFHIASYLRVIFSTKSPWIVWMEDCKISYPIFASQENSSVRVVFRLTILWNICSCWQEKLDQEQKNSKFINCHWSTACFYPCSLIYKMFIQIVYSFTSIFLFQVCMSCDGTSRSCPLSKRACQAGWCESVIV